jgi:origin recognition complex subunit 5
MKYLLISSFLASYNPAKLDRRYFTKLSETKAKNTKIGKKSKKKLSPLLLGPSVFPLERLVAIYSAISSSPNIDVILWNQVSSLKELGFVRGQSWEKLKCNLEYRVVERVAHGIGFKLDHYLHVEVN